jgi:hypothetical protein
MASSIKPFQTALGDPLSGYAVHPRDVRLPLVSKVTALPFSDL